VEPEQVQQITIEELNSLSKYLWVLIDSYPTPINQSEIANRTDVSRSAITRIKNSLNRLCDLKSLAYERKMVLKNDFDTRFLLVFHFLWNGTLTEFKSFLDSKYFMEMVLDTDLYTKIKETHPDFPIEKYYTKEDISWLMTFFVKKMVNYQPKMENDLIVGLNVERDGVVQQIIAQNFPLNFAKMYMGLFDSSLSFLETESDFLKVLELRDKTQLLLLENTEIYSGVLNEITSWLDADEEATVRDATLVLFHALMKKTFKLLSEHVYSEAYKLGIEIDSRDLHLKS